MNLLKDIKILGSNCFNRKSLQLVRDNGLNLKHIENQTEYICLEAIENNWEALQFVKSQNLNICITAYIKNKNALKYIQSEELKCLLFEELAKIDIQYINDIPIEYVSIINKIIRESPNMLSSLSLDDDVLLELIKIDISLLKYIKPISQYLLFKSIEINEHAIYFLNKPIPDSSKYESKLAKKNIANYIANRPHYLKRNSYAIRYIETPTSTMIINSLRSNPEAFKYIKNLEKHVFLEVLKEMPEAIELIKHPSEELLLDYLCPDGMSEMADFFKTVRAVKIGRNTSHLDSDTQIEILNKSYEFEKRFKYILKKLNKISQDNIAKLIDMHPSFLLPKINHMKNAEAICKFVKSSRRNPRYFINDLHEFKQLEILEQNPDTVKYLPLSSRRFFSQKLFDKNKNLIKFLPDDSLDFIDKIEEFNSPCGFKVIAYKIYGESMFFVNNESLGYSLDDFPSEQLINLDSISTGLILDFIKNF